MRVRLIVNPRASSMTERRRHVIETSLRAGHDVEPVTTTARNHAHELAAAAAADGVDVVVVAGGDGTLNEAAGGLVGSSTALACLPGGSTNVFARAVGFGNRLERATERLLVALARGSIHRIGVGAANDRYFLFHLGAGFDAAVVERIERNPIVKRYAAHPAFALAMVRTLASGFDRREAGLHVECAGEQHRPAHDSFFTVVANVIPYTFVGPRRMILTRDAALDRALAVTSFTRFTLRDVASAVGSSVATARRLGRDPHIVQLRDVDALRISARDPRRPVPWQVDGDYLGTVDTLAVRYVPEALSVVLPA